MITASIQSLSSCAADATRLASLLRVPMHEIALHSFPDSETRVTVGPVARTTILYATLDHPDHKLIALVLAAEALRSGGCTRIVLVAPYLCYMRQDTAFHAGEANSQKAIGKLIAGLVDRVITVDAHLHRTSDIQQVFPHTTADNLSAIEMIADSLRNSALDPATVLIGPDAESRQWVSSLAGQLNLNYVIANKTRRSDRSVDIDIADRAMISGRPALIMDDIVSTGETMKACAKVLATAGATSIEAIVTHALFPHETLDDLTRAGIRLVRSTHSVPHPTNAIALDHLLASALREEIDSLVGPRTST